MSALISEIASLRARPDTLPGLAPAIRSMVQGAARDRDRAMRACNLLAAEDARRVMVAAGELLQLAEDRA